MTRTSDAGSSTSQSRALVSVVVPTKDAIRTIERCLRSIREQTWPSVQLVVVDNWSTDGTWEVAQEWADLAMQAGPERSAQRNLGIERAHGEWILWIDADMELPATILERVVGVADRDDADAVFVPEVTIGDGYWTRCRALERSCCTEEILVQSPRLVRRQYLLDTGGFLTSLSGTEDAELRTRMIEDGRVLARVPDMIVHDEGRLRFVPILRKRYYYGKGLTRYGHDHPGALSGQATAAMRSYIRNWRRLVAQPTVAVGVLAMRAGEFVAYGLGAFAGVMRATTHTSSRNADTGHRSPPR